MPPRNSSPYREPDDHLPAILEELQRLDPHLDTRPGSVVRALAEGLAKNAGDLFDRVAAQAGQLDLPRYGSALTSQLTSRLTDLSLEYAQLERALYAGLGLGQLSTPLGGTSADTLRQLYGNQPPLDREWVERNIMAPEPPEPRPLTRDDFRRFFEQFAQMPLRPDPPPLLDAQTYRDIYGFDPAPPVRNISSPSPLVPTRDQVLRAREELMAQEDQAVFDLLDRHAPSAPRTHAGSKTSASAAREEMKKVALPIRTTSWTRILNVEELDYPV